MPTLHLKVPLSDEAMAYLSEILTEEKGETTASHWLFANALKPRIKETAETRKLVRARGSLDLPGGKKVTPADFDIGPLESFPEGQVEFTLSERVVGWIEESAGYITAVNQRTGGTLLWTTPAEWVREICLAAIATRAAKLDGEELDDEEKANYPPADKDGRPAPRKA